MTYLLEAHSYNDMQDSTQKNKEENADKTEREIPFALIY